MSKKTKLYNGDCLTILPQLIKDNTKIDLILTDPPYGTVKGLNLDGWKNSTTDWDNQLPTEEIFKYCEKLLRVNGKMILFSQEPYTSHLRTQNYPNLNFIYPLYWLKDHFANALSCKKAPVSYVEDISVFHKQYDTDNSHPLRTYAQKLLKEMGVTGKDIERKLGHRRAEHFFYNKDSSQFSLCTEQTYNELIDVYHIDQYSMFKSYDDLKRIDTEYNATFNLNNAKFKSNVLQYKKPYNRHHPTEKPVDLLKDLILTYTNPNDTVLDFTMGSGSTGVACMETDRNFIGIELDKEYYTIAVERMNNPQTKLL